MAEVFLSTPYLFYTENDLHCYFCRLLSKQLEDSGFGLYETLDLKLSSLLHKEYPTKKRYRQKLLEEDPTGRRGHFELFWRRSIVTEELYIFGGDRFKKYPKTKKVDLSLGILEGKVIHPFAVISCKLWYGADWLDADRDVFDRIRSRYPHVFGYAVCMSYGVKPVSLISAQRTGMKIFELYNPKKDLFQLDSFLSNLQSVINNA